MASVLAAKMDVMSMFKHAEAAVCSVFTVTGSHVTGVSCQFSVLSFFLSASNHPIYRLPASVSQWHLSYPDDTSVFSALFQVAIPAALYRLIQQKRKTSRDQMRIQ